MKFKVQIAVLISGCLSFFAFQNCSSKTTISSSDAAQTSTNGGGTAGIDPVLPPTVLPPFMFQNLWKTLAPTTPPPPLYGHSAVYTGTKVIIWGGNNSLSTIAPAGGYVLDLAANAWSALAGGPSARTKHTAVWTGKEMVIWGGIVNATTAAVTNDGGIYNPTTGTWTPIPAFGPTARANHGAVWTGTEMIVWGGVDSANNALGDGGIYNPATNAWRTMSSTGAPSARKHASTVWTGSKMLVWGGANGLGTVFLNDGALYDPATDKWSALTQLTPPSVRQWASIDMAPNNGLAFIFGGHNGVALGNGYSLDLASGQWTQISATGAPAARYGNIQVMTSQGMLIHGGTDGTNMLSASFLYY